MFGTGERPVCSTVFCHSTAGRALTVAGCAQRRLAHFTRVLIPFRPGTAASGSSE